MKRYRRTYPEHLEIKACQICNDTIEIFDFMPIRVAVRTNGTRLSFQRSIIFLSTVAWHCAYCPVLLLTQCSTTDRGTKIHLCPAVVSDPAFIKMKLQVCINPFKMQSNLPVKVIRTTATTRYAVR